MIVKLNFRLTVEIKEDNYNSGVREYRKVLQNDFIQNTFYFIVA